MDKDYYGILGVDKSASEDDLRRAFRSLSKRYHPDLQQGKSESEKKEAEEKFKEINEAYSVLGDKEKRKQYDTFGSTASDMGDFGPGGFDPMEFFRSRFDDDFDNFGFGFGPGPGRRHSRPSPDSPKNGRSVEIGLEISFEEAFFGTTREFDIKFPETCEHCKGTGSDDGQEHDCDMCGGTGMYTRRIAAKSIFMQSITCPKCHGRGSMPTTNCHICGGKGAAPTNHHLNIHIPRGVDTGDRLRISGEGEHGLNGGKAGDLYITLQVENSELFERNGNNLHVDVHVPSPAIGVLDKVEIPTPYGKRTVEIPKNPRPDGTFVVRVENCGVKSDRTGTGDLIARIVPEPPANMTESQKKMCEKLLKSLDRSNMTESMKRNEALWEKFEKESKKFEKTT